MFSAIPPLPEIASHVSSPSKDNEVSKNLGDLCLLESKDLAFSNAVESIDSSLEEQLKEFMTVEQIFFQAIALGDRATVQSLFMDKKNYN